MALPDRVIGISSVEAERFESEWAKVDR